MQITSSIWQVGGQGLTAAEDAAVYLCCMDGRAAVIDAGCGQAGQRLADNIAAYKVGPAPIDTLLLTHCHFDHTGGAADLRNRMGCTVVAHEGDASALAAGGDRRTAASWYGRQMEPLSLDRVLAGERQSIPLGSGQVEMIHTPGHTPGSVVYLVVSDGLRVLFGQDVHGPLHADFDSDRNAYRKSLERMAALEADILCEGHYGIIQGSDPVQAFIRSFL